MRLLFAGTPDTALPSLDAVLASRHEVVAVLTRPDARSGRGRRDAPSPVAERARAQGLEVLTPQRPGDAEFIARLAEIAPDCAPVVAYGGLIPPPALAVPRLGWVNLHFSILPAWRGAAPVQHAVLAGDQVTGASTFLLTEGLDTGPVLGVVTEGIAPTDTAGDVLGRLAVSGAHLLVATLDAMAEGAVRPVPQPGEGVSLAPKLAVQDARVDWAAPALRVDRLVRACTPSPGAWTTLRGLRVRLGPVGPVPDEQPTLAPAEIQVERARVLVGTGSRAVELGAVTPAGRRPMSAADWARGLRLSTGERFDQ